MTEDDKRPLPAAVSEFMNDRHGATPVEVMNAVEVDERFRAQIEHYCAVTRFTMFGGDVGCEIPDGVRVTTVEWADVADWDVPTESIGADRSAEPADSSAGEADG